jgi:hypothetical protein
MGNSIASAMAENQKALMKEMQAEQLSNMWDQMVRGQERMRRLQMSFMMAMTKERLNWLGGLYGAFTVGLTGYFIKNKKIPPMALAPLIVG